MKPKFKLVKVEYSEEFNACSEELVDIFVSLEAVRKAFFKLTAKNIPAFYYEYHDEEGYGNIYYTNDACEKEYEKVKVE